MKVWRKIKFPHTNPFFGMIGAKENIGTHAAVAANGIDCIDDLQKSQNAAKNYFCALYTSTYISLDLFIELSFWDECILLEYENLKNLFLH